MKASRPAGFRPGIRGKVALTASDNQRPAEGSAINGEVAADVRIHNCR